VPASIEPIITLCAQAANAFEASPENLIPPSAITVTLVSFSASATSDIALN
jgi:hypothetical protein